jgi:hypothetical protein
MNNQASKGHFLEIDSSTYMVDRCDIAVMWTGPFAWTTFEPEANLPPIPNHSGVYLMTVEYLNGYLIYAAGITRRPIPSRFREHNRKYMSGDYTVLDITALKQGIRKEIWHGWGWTPEKRTDYESRKVAIEDSARQLLAGYRIFVANVTTQPRILERLEASIMNRLYQEPSPFCDILDRGMMLSPRWESEEIIVVKNECPVMLHGLPRHLEI